MINRPQILLVNRAIIHNSKNQILIIKRSELTTYMTNKWELPGGKLDIGQDAVESLVREVYEETGLTIKLIDKIAYWHSTIVKEGKYEGLPYIVIVGVAKPVMEKEITLSDENSDFKWVSYEESLEYDLVPETRNALISLKS